MLGQLCALLLLSSCGTPQFVDVTYRLSGTAHTARAAYRVADGEMRGDLDLPWQTTVRLPRGAEAYLTAHNALMGGTVTCEIIVGGQVLTRQDAATYREVADCRVSVSDP